MELQALKYFCTVASEGSLSKAAGKLHYAQSNLSTKIMQLEQEIGTPLFYRNNHGVTLTPKGDMLLKYATNLLNLAEETMVAMKDDGEAEGILKIGSMESTVVSYLSGFLADFHKKNPLVSIQVETGTTDMVLQKVLDHSLNGGFVAGPVKHPELFTKQIRTEQLCLLASSTLASNSNLQDMLALPLLVFPTGCSYRKKLENLLNDSGLTANKVYEFNTLNAIFASVAAGLGVALFPESCVKQYWQRDDLTILDVPDKYALSSTVFVYRKDSYLSSAMCGFINQLG
ncbi:MAG: LysR family transcriptional regulator [Lachnospiraceae bacterium]|nr:LysR family transcriptional regulator [Lachnospiraceae bacterium]MDD3617244.1 LysR family transcriptional regulator [Lachnospiraceae bacterium]